MSIPPEALRAFRDTEYRVRLPRGGWAVIRIGAPLPRVLHGLLRDEAGPWGFITAWNPLAQRIPRARNRERQRALRAALLDRGARLCAGVGAGADDGENAWRESSLFVTGLDFAALDELGRRFGQAAIVRGTGGGPAELRVLV
jgi:hypothetical protein